MIQKFRAWLHSKDAHIYYWSLAITLAWRVGLEVLNQSVVPNMLVGPGSNGLQVLHPGIAGLLRWVNAWDAPWYATITQHGYVIEHHFQGYESVAFFPLFPYLVRWLMLATHLPYQLIGLVINALFTSLIVFVVFKLTHLIAVENKLTKEADSLSKLAALFVLINPSAFFFAAYYADALLVLLVLAAIYAAHRDSYWWAALFAGLATGVKSIGIVALPAVLLIYFARHNERLIPLIRSSWLKLGAFCLLGVSGLVSYMLYLGLRFGEPLAFLKVEKYWSRNISGFFLSDIWHIWYEKILTPVYFRPMSNYLYDLFLMLIPIITVGFAVYLIARHRLQYAWLAVLCVLTILIPMSTGTLLSLNRYALLMLPALSYIFVYIYTRSKAARSTIMLMGYGSAVMLIVFVLTFLSFRFAG